MTPTMRRGVFGLSIFGASDLESSVIIHIGFAFGYILA
jgi:hypothetical protein